MLEPRCIVCKGTENCHLARFISSRSGHKYRQQCKRGEIDGGHDPDHQWFCNRHVSQANKYSTIYNAKEAISLIKQY